MKKANTKRSTYEGAIYMKFKSYPSKKPVTSKINCYPNQKSIDSAKAPPANFDSGENVIPDTRDSVGERCYRYVELQKELQRLKENEAEFSLTIKKLDLENATLRNRMKTFIPAEQHEKVKFELDKTKRRFEDLSREINKLRESNRIHVNTVDKLNTKIAQLQSTQRDLSVQIDTEKRIKMEQVIMQDKLTAEKERLEEIVVNLTNENDILNSEKNDLTARVEELKQKIEGLMRKIHVLYEVQKKLKNREIEVENVMKENQVLATKNESCTRFVQILETDIQNVKNEKKTADEQNAALRKQNAVVKKSLEHLRQKYDELHRQFNRLKEKEMRYLVHEGFHISKYAQNIPTSSVILDDKNKSRRLKSTYVPPCYMRAAKNASKLKPRDSNMYNLLHRAENSESSKKPDGRERAKSK